MFSLEIFLMMGLVKLDKLHVSTRKGKGNTRQRDRQTDRERQRQTNRDKEGARDRQADRDKEEARDRETGRQTDIETQERVCECVWGGGA